MESHGRHSEDLYDTDQVFQGGLSELLLNSLQWLARQQNPDGGWGDTDRSHSNIATTYLVVAAFRMTAVPAGNARMLEQADAYIVAEGSIAGLRKRFGKDKTFAAPILACCALAGMVSWRDVPALPFELACIPQKWYRLVKMPVVSYAIPALVAIGQAKFHFAPPLNPAVRLLRKSCLNKSLELVEKMQPESGGFLEATPLTSFVVMSFASTGMAEHPIVRRGVEFLLASLRPDGSWPIDSNLAMWNTTLAMNALMPRGNDGKLQTQSDEVSEEDANCLNWVLDNQHLEKHPFTAAEPGGWAWTDLSGGVPDIDDTSGALLFLAKWRSNKASHQFHQIEHAARMAVRWLLDMQNKDGGWPTFCKGWGKLPFDRSGTDLTAHAMRALFAWQKLWDLKETSPDLDAEIASALGKGLAYLHHLQQENGSWLPLWFGNQDSPEELNSVYGTSKVLMMLSELGYTDSLFARKAATWLTTVQHASGGWGAVAGKSEKSEPDEHYTTTEDLDPCLPLCSVEETALATTALLAMGESYNTYRKAAKLGESWLIDAIQNGKHKEPAPIGLYFAKLWYYEKLYPIVFAVEALRASADCDATKSNQEEKISVNM